MDTVSRWNKSSGCSSLPNGVESESRKWAPDVWKPKFIPMFCQTEASEGEFFTMSDLEITGQKLAICPNISSTWVTSCCSVRTFWVSASSSEKSWSNERTDFSARLTPSKRNGVKFESNDNTNNMFRHDHSNDVTISRLERDRWFEGDHRRSMLNRRDHKVRHFPDAHLPV